MKKATAFLKIITSGKSPWPARILLCLSVLLAYASVWPNGFVFDDKDLIAFNPSLQSWDDFQQLLMHVKQQHGMVGGFYRPVTMLIYFLIFQACGSSTVAFHALNVAVQALNACLLHHFGLRAGFRKGAALAAALLWAVHPLFTIDVAYMASTAELLWSSFCLLGLIALLPDFTPAKVWKAMIFFVLALGCKESAVVFPALAGATFFFVSRERARPAAYLKTWRLWLLSAGYIAAWLLFIHTSADKGTDYIDAWFYQNYTSRFANRALTSLSTLPLYIGMIVVPTGLHIERMVQIFPTLLAWQPLTGAFMAALVFLQILWGKARRGLALSFGLLWFCIALSPYTGIVLPIDGVISESWMYMPAMGLFLGVTQTAAGFFERRQNAARVLVPVLAFSLGLATFFQNGVWRDTGTLYQNILENHGQVARLREHMGVFYINAGEYDKAIALFQYTIDHPVGRARSQLAHTHIRLAMAWLHIHLDDSQIIKMGDIARALPASQHIPEAIMELGKAIQDNPDDPWPHMFLAAIYRYQDNTQMADFHDRKADAILKKQENLNP